MEQPRPKAKPGVQNGARDGVVPLTGPEVPDSERCHSPKTPNPRVLPTGSCLVALSPYLLLSHHLKPILAPDLSRKCSPLPFLALPPSYVATACCCGLHGPICPSVSCCTSTLSRARGCGGGIIPAHRARTGPEASTQLLLPLILRVERSIPVLDCSPLGLHIHQRDKWRSATRRGEAARGRG